MHPGWDFNPGPKWLAIVAAPHHPPVPPVTLLPLAVAVPPLAIVVPPVAVVVSPLLPLAIDVVVVVVVAHRCHCPCYRGDGNGGAIAIAFDIAVAAATTIAATAAVVDCYVFVTPTPKELTPIGSNHHGHGRTLRVVRRRTNVDGFYTDHLKRLLPRHAEEDRRLIHVEDETPVSSFNSYADSVHFEKKSTIRRNGNLMDLAVTPAHISWFLNPGLYGKFSRHPLQND